MSTTNIIKIVPTEAGVIVVFKTHRGDIYDPESGAQIMNGADPANFQGTKL